MPAPDHVEAPSWSIRPEQPVDIDQIHELHREAFRGPAEAELVDAIRAGAGFVPELSLVAVAADDSVLGHILISRIGFEPERGESDDSSALALAPLSVLPPHQARGIGSALVREALAVADLRDESLVAVLGGQSFYEDFGFEPAAEFNIHSPYHDAGPAFQVRPIGERPIEPGSLIYPAMFGPAAG
jgi:putative acetyltransferase